MKENAQVGTFGRCVLHLVGVMCKGSKSLLRNEMKITTCDSSHFILQKHDQNGDYSEWHGRAGWKKINAKKCCR